MLRYRYKELFTFFYEQVKDKSTYNFITLLKAFLSDDSNFDRKIAKSMNINELELTYLKQIAIEQMTLNSNTSSEVILNESENNAIIRYYNKYFTDYTKGLMSINQDFSSTLPINYLDSDVVDGLIEYFISKLYDGSAKYVYTDREKECVYDIFEVIAKNTGKYDNINIMLQEEYKYLFSKYAPEYNFDDDEDEDEDEDEEIYNDEIEAQYDDDLSGDETLENDYEDSKVIYKDEFEIDDDEDEDDYMPTSSDMIDMFNICYDEIEEVLYRNYPSEQERKRFINFLVAACYANEKIHNEHAPDLCVFPNMLEREKTFDLKRIDRPFLITFIHEYLLIFNDEGINLNAIYSIKNKETLEILKKIDMDLYHEFVNMNDNLFIFGGQIGEYIDDIIDSRYAALKYNDMYAKQKERLADGEEVLMKDMDEPSEMDKNRYFETICRDILSYDIFSDYTEFDFNDNKRNFIRISTIRRITALFFESVHYNYDILSKEFKKIHDDLLNGKYKSNNELINLFNNFGHIMLKTYANLIKDKDFYGVCQNKIYNDNLVNFITTLDPSSTFEYLNRIMFKNIESVMNCNELFKQISDENSISREEFVDILNELNISEVNAIGSILTIVYENMLYRNEKDNEIAFLVEKNELDDIANIVLNNENLFFKIIARFKRYMSKDYSIEKELKCRKDLKVKQKKYVISRINPYYKEEEETFK